MDPESKDTQNFHDRFHIGNFIGDGNFSVVKECFEKSSGAKHAVKIVQLKGSKTNKDEYMQMMINEVDVMKKLNNQNLIKCIDAFFGNDEILLVLEYTENGDLYDFIVNSEQITEDIARDIMLDIGNALQYLHSQSIVHRDIKPENFLLFQSPTLNRDIVKLCDFGLAVEVNRFLTEVCGSPSYVAPEVLLMDGYGLAVDVWSSGVVLYILLCQFPPFYAETDGKLFSKIMLGQFNFPSPYWDHVSDGAKDLVTKMLILDEEKRMKASDILRHPWIMQSSAPKDNNENVSKKMSSKKGLKEVAVAVRCVNRLMEPIKRPVRERASLSRSMIEKSETVN